MRVWGSGSTSALTGTVVVSDERTFAQDPMFAFRILVDVAIRALSPAVNDPTTATQCLHRIEALLISVGNRALEADTQRDAAGTIRLVVPSPSWDDYLDLALSEIRRAGDGQFQVVRRLRALLDRLERSCPEIRHAAIARHRVALDEVVSAQFPLDADRRFASVPDAQGIGGAHRSG